MNLDCLTMRANAKGVYWACVVAECVELGPQLGSCCPLRLFIENDDFLVILKLGTGYQQAVATMFLPAGYVGTSTEEEKQVLCDSL